MRELTEEQIRRIGGGFFGDCPEFMSLRVLKCPEGHMWSTWLSFSDYGRVLENDAELSCPDCEREGVVVGSTTVCTGRHTASFEERGKE